MEILADEDYYENVVIEEENKNKYFAFLSKEMKSNMICMLNQSCLNLTQTSDDQRYKYLVIHIHFLIIFAESA